jgi:hypothetical protein
MSLGGALGGMFTALVAPKLFSEVYEYPLLLALSMACRPGALSLPRDKDKAWSEAVMLWLIAAAGLLLLLCLDPEREWVAFIRERVPLVALYGPTLSTLLVLAAVLAFTVRHAPRQLVAAGLMCLALVWLPSTVRQTDSLVTQRSFFGVYRVTEDRTPTGLYRKLVHGTTLHGAQRVLDERGRAVDDTVPTTYYYPGSPIGQTISKRREVLGTQKGHYGIVGLGTGSSACHKQEGESWKFFEIDPTVIRIAEDKTYFTFISRCQPDIDIAVGDARLTIARESDASFDLFIIDAFTSDAIPVHMLTKEAVELFLRKLKPDGVVLLHTSNRYLDLEGVLASTLELLPKGTAGVVVQDRRADPRKSPAQSSSSVVIFTKSEEALEPYRSLDGASELVGRDPPLRAWTDDYSDILGAFLSRKLGRDRAR